MRSASLSIGIVEYLHPAYSSSSRRLKFATDDARAFSMYLRTAFGEADGTHNHRLLEDHEALFDNAQRELKEIAQGGNLELFVLYLAGHGEQGDSRGGWFCLANATPSDRSLDGELLERLLDLIRAESILVVIDCCHAEAVVAGMRFFASLENGRARLFIASARRDQLAWEDDGLKRSVLSDVLLRACSTISPVQDSSGVVNVESALFPYLRQQVPLLAAAQKQGAIQEPVSGGSARADVELPVVESISFGRTLTIAQTVRERLRQILVKGLVAIVILLFGSELLIYHLAADSRGRILVRPGLPITHALVPVALVEDTDTGMRVDDLSTSDPRFAEAVARSRIWGFSSHLDTYGINPWFSRLTPILGTDTRIRAEALTIAAKNKQLPEDSPPPLDETLFLSLLRNEQPIVAAHNFYPVPDFDAVECVQGNPHNIDISILMAPAVPYGRDLKWRSLLARSDQAGALAAIEAEVQNTSYRLREGENTESALADILQLAFSLTALRPYAPAPISEDLRRILASDLDTPCRVHAAVALRIFGFGDDGARAEGLLLKDIQAFDSETQGVLPTASQTIAARGLAAMVAAHPFEGSTLDALAAALIREDPDLERTTLPWTVLIATAQRQPLPKSLLDHLFARLETPAGEYSFGYLQALKMLANNMAFLSPESEKRIGAWLDHNAARNHTFEEVHEAIGFLLSVDPTARPELINILVDRLSPQTYFPAPALSYRGEPIIYSTGDAAAVALGRVLQSHVLATDVEERLVRFAIGRKDAPDRQVIVDGLAKRWYTGGVTPADVVARIRAATGDAGRRLLEVDVACSRLVGMPSVTRDSTVAGLLSLWRVESEPEVRSAIARLVARSQWPRYADMTMCSGG